MPEEFTIIIQQKNSYDQWCVQEIRDCGIYLILDKDLSNVSWKEKNKIFKETNFEEAGKLAKLLGSCEEEPDEYILTSTF